MVAGSLYVFGYNNSGTFQRAARAALPTLEHGGDVRHWQPTWDELHFDIQAEDHCIDVSQDLLVLVEVALLP